MVIFSLVDGEKHLILDFVAKQQKNLLTVKKKLFNILMTMAASREFVKDYQ